MKKKNGGDSLSDTQSLFIDKINYLKRELYNWPRGSRNPSDLTFTEGYL